MPGQTAPPESRHWLFEAPYYLAQLTAQGQQVPDDPYAHFLTIGDAQGLRPGMFFLPEIYLDLLPPRAAAEARAIGAFRHFVTHHPPCRSEPRLSPYFDPDWYGIINPEAVAAVRSGAVPSLLAHYRLALKRGVRPDPLPLFSERFYLGQYPDVAAAVAAGHMDSGYTHFLWHGQHEGRAFGPGPTLAQHLARHPGAAEDASARGLPDLFAHLVMQNPRFGYPPPDVAQTDALLQIAAEIGLRNLQRHPLDFSLTGRARISVVMALEGDLAARLATLECLKGQIPGAVELILTGTAALLDEVAPLLRGARLIALDAAGGRVAGWNAGIAAASTGAVLIMGAGCRPAADALERGLLRLAADPATAAVGGLVLRSNNTVAEAGAILRRDGQTEAYMQGASADAAEHRFLRAVDFCSGAFLLLDGAMVRQLGGFDPDLAAGIAEAELCLRLRQSGRRVVYDPKIRLVAPVIAGPDAAALSDSRMRLVRYQAAALRKQPAAELSPHLARVAGGGRRVLLIEDCLPLRRAGSGYVRSNDIVHMLDSLGFEVSVLGLNPPLADLDDIEADFPETVEILQDRHAADLPALLAERRGGFDTIWLCRTPNLDRIGQMVQGAARQLILDTEAIISLRAGQEAQIEGRAFDLKAALAQELAQIGLADRVLAVSAAEAAILRAHGHPRSHVLGHTVVARPAPGPEGRQGLLFLGAIHDARVPNYDSLIWFVTQVLDRMAALPGPRLRLSIAGYVAPGVDMSPFAGRDDIDLLGTVGDLAPLFDRHRVFVAPTRIAAGVPFKLTDAAAFGLPAVATALLTAQLGWQDGVEILAAPTGDAGAFARQIRRLYDDDDLWCRLQRQMQDRITRDHAPEVYRATIAGMMDQG